MLSSGGISPFNIFTRLWSSEVDQVLSRFPNSLEGDETRVARSVQRAVDLGVWDNVDEFFALSMADAGNSLVGWKSKTATAVNSPTHTANQGYLFNGTNQYLNTNWIPSVEAAAGSNYQQDSAHVTCYCHTNFSSSGEHLWGVLTLVPTCFIHHQQGFSSGIPFRVNSSDFTNYTAAGSAFINSTRYDVDRDDSANHELYINGLQVISGAANSTGTPTKQIFIGCLNNDGSATNHINARVSHFLIGGGFNLTNLKTWLDYHELLFVVLPEVLGRYTGLSDTEKTAIETFVTAEYTNGNWHLYDEMFIFPLGSSNGLIGLKGTTATNVNNCTFDVGGVLTNGADNYIDTTIIPSSGLTQASLNDIDIQCFVTENLDAGVSFLLGCTDGTNSLRTLQSGANIQIQLNDTASYSNNAEGVFADLSLYGSYRVDGTNITLSKNGGDVNSATRSTTLLPAFSIYLGCQNNQDSPSNYINAKIATFKIGAAIGFDQSAHNTNVRALLTTLGTI